MEANQELIRLATRQIAVGGWYDLFRHHISSRQPSCRKPYCFYS
jgi:hypothetical protein